MEATNNRYIPMEIVEEILCNLPLKSLVRFSCVSNSWNSMISESELIRKHLSRRKRMVINPFWCKYLNTASTCPLSSIPSNQPIIIKDATDLICPFQGNPQLLAFCDELWSVQVENSLFLWNPSMRTYRKLPDPSLPPWPGTAIYEFVYGLGYDAVGDDYKILKLPTVNYPTEAELYSLRSDSWRKIDQPFPGNPVRLSKGVFVSGALHWMVDGVIISFDLSTEKYGKVVQPEYSPTPIPGDNVKVIVLRALLCVCLNYRRDTRFVLWVMKDYGVAKSWSKMFDIQYCNSVCLFRKKLGRKSLITLAPLYLYDNGEILIKVIGCLKNSNIFIMYKDEKATPQKIIGRRSFCNFSDCFLYVESLISPAIWLTTAPIVGNNKA